MKIACILIAVLFGIGHQTLFGSCSDGVQPSGAKYRICLPDGTWNRQLLVYAHGYVSPTQPIAIPEDQLTLPDGTSLPNLFTSLGYAFAVSSYRTNGLAILEGRDDLKELTGIFVSKYGKPDAVYLGGVSEGGLVGALSAEQLAGTYDSVIGACGPIGSFSGQIDYMGDARLLFDYYFPGVLPGTVVSVPPQLSANWDTVYVPAVTAALAANPVARQNFLGASHIPDAGDLVTTTANITNVLGYSANATNDAALKLKGQPYDNHDRFYFGSSNDFDLNTRIARFTADPAAVQSMKAYETSGKPRVPFVTLHTTADPVVPYFHEILYYGKTAQNNSLDKLKQIPVFRNGHCAFQIGDVLWAFIVLLAQKSGSSPQEITRNMTEAQRRLLPAEIRRQLALQ